MSQDEGVGIFSCAVESQISSIFHSFLYYVSCSNFFFWFSLPPPFPSITSLFFSILLSNWKVGGLCSKDMGS